MANHVRRLSRDENNPVVPPSGFSRPTKPNTHFPDQELKTTFRDNAYLSERFDPYRARLAQIAHPILRQLRASKWHPKDRENTNRGLLEQMLYLAESQLQE